MKEKLGITCNRLKLNPDLTPFTKVKLKCLKIGAGDEHSTLNWISSTNPSPGGLGYFVCVTMCISASVCVSYAFSLELFFSAGLFVLSYSGLFAFIQTYFIF